MEKISIIKSTAVLVPTANIDTDQIIPARFLKTTSLKEQVLNAESSIHNISMTGSKQTSGAVALGQQTRNAVLVVAMVPMLIVFPFVQRYFISGVMLGSVIVMGFPALICSIQRGITLPRLHITLPYLVQQIVVFSGSTVLDFATITFSIIALLVPIALTG